MKRCSILRKIIDFRTSNNTYSIAKNLRIIICLLFISSNYIHSAERIFFDDFSYSSINIPAAVDSAEGSIFGYNDWIYSDETKKSKGWYRWNIGEPNYDSLCGIELKGYGFDLYYKSGANPNKPHPLLPMIHSTVKFKHGTYASRVRFPKNYDNDLSIFAYWLFSPISFKFYNGNERIQYTSEMDFEWNNWFKGKNHENMVIGCNNHNYKNPIQCALKLSVFEKGKKLSINGFNNKIKNNDIFYNQWFICVFIVDTINQITKIYMNSDYDSLPDIRTFGGLDINSANEFKPFEINYYSPDYDMVLMYSISMIDPVSNDNRMGVDWTYYSPEVNLNHDDIKANVHQLKSSNITRLNGVDAPVYIHDNGSSIVDCYIYGPDSALHGVDTEWKLDTEYLRWSAYEVEMSYRAFDKINGWGSWSNHYSNKIRFNSSCIYDSMEINVKLKDEYYDIYDSINKKIHFTHNPNCLDDSTTKIQITLYPNPVFYTLYLKQPDSVCYNIPGIQIISIHGKILFESEFKPLIDVCFLPPGIYFLKAKNQYFKFIKL